MFAVSAVAAEVKLWVRREEVAAEINTDHVNRQYTAEAPIPPNIVATTSIAGDLWTIQSSSGLHNKDLFF